jgi:hypothetical protein
VPAAGVPSGNCKGRLSAHALHMTSPPHSWLQGIKKLKNQPMVGFNGRTNGLQVNVGFGGLQDKVPLS